jgi:hypothetical protein
MCRYAHTFKHTHTENHTPVSVHRTFKVFQCTEAHNTQMKAWIHRQSVAHNKISELFSSTFNFCMQLLNSTSVGFTYITCSPKEQQQFMPKEHGGHDHPHPKLSANQFIIIQAPNTLCRMSKTTFTVCGCTSTH